MHFVGSDRFPKNYEAFRALTGIDFEMLLQFSQMMESLGILVADGLVDIDLVDKTLGTYVTTTWNKYKIFMVPARERDPYLSEYFQWLSDRMEERQAKTPREPFYKTPHSDVVYKK